MPRGVKKTEEVVETPVEEVVETPVETTEEVVETISEPTEIVFEMPKYNGRFQYARTEADKYVVISPDLVRISPELSEDEARDMTIKFNKFK